jgi:predicted GIY-YIG superfamily endonuclease
MSKQRVDRTEELKTIYERFSATDATKKLYAELTATPVPWNVVLAATENIELAQFIMDLQKTGRRTATNITDALKLPSSFASSAAAKTSDLSAQFQPEPLTTIYLPTILIYCAVTSTEYSKLMQAHGDCAPQQLICTVFDGDPGTYFAFSFYVYGVGAKSLKSTCEYYSRALGHTIFHIRDGFFTAPTLRVGNVAEYYSLLDEFLNSVSGPIHAPNFREYTAGTANVTSATQDTSSPRYFLAPISDCPITDAPEYFDTAPFEDTPCLYVLQLEDPDHYKFGITADIVRRLREHRAGIKYKRVLGVYPTTTVRGMKIAESQYKNYAISKNILTNRRGYTEVVNTKSPADLDMIRELVERVNVTTQLHTTSTPPSRRDYGKPAADPDTMFWFMNNPPTPKLLSIFADYYAKYVAEVKAPIPESKFKKICNKNLACGY